MKAKNILIGNSLDREERRQNRTGVPLFSCLTKPGFCVRLTSGYLGSSELQQVF